MCADLVTPAVRSRMMSGIRGKDTKPEMVIRSALHGRGFRYRLHDRKLPGRPDLVFRSRSAVIFVHGCFWHGHGCHLFKWPKSREGFWREKIGGNITRDKRQLAELHEAGWRTGIIWECALKGGARLLLDDVILECAEWLNSDTKTLEIAGHETRPAF